MTREPTSRDTSLKIRRAWLRPLLSFLVIAGGAAMLASLLLIPRSGFKAPLSEHVAYRLAGAVTRANPLFQDRSFSARVYRKLPPGVQSWVDVTTGYKPHEITYQATRAWGEVDFVLEPTRIGPASEKSDGSLFAAAVEKYGYKQAVFWMDVGNGQYRQLSSLSPLYSHSYRDSDYFGRVLFTDVPHTVEKLNLELWSPSFRGPSRLIYSKTITNPLYEKLEPIGTPQQLPTVIKKQGISVTLEALVSSAAEPGGDATDTGASTPADMLVRNTKAGHPFKSAIVFRVKDGNAWGSHWGVDTIKVEYAKSAIPISWAGVSRPIDVEDEAGLAQIFRWEHDISVYQHPVRVTAHVIKRGGFVPDELVTAEFDMPTEKENERANILRVGGRGSDQTIGPVRPRLAIANVKLWGDELRVHIYDLTDDERLLAVELMKDNGATLNLNSRLTSKEFKKSYGSQTISASYDLGGDALDKSDQSIEPEEYDKVRVTVVSPPRIEVPFEFIAEPSGVQTPGHIASR